MMSGPEYSLHNEVYPIFNPEHTIVEHVAIFAADITEQKKAEAALQESERKYRFLIDNVRDIIWQTTSDLSFTYVSPAAESLTGYPPRDLIGTSLFEILTDASARDVRERLRQRMEEYATGKQDLATVFEAEIRKKDKGLLWLEVSSNAIFGPDGSLTGFQGIGRDITKRREVEDALRESEVKLDFALHSAEMGVWQWNIQTDRRYFDDQTCYLLGIAPFSGLPKNFFPLSIPMTARY